MPYLLPCRRPFKEMIDDMLQEVSRVMLLYRERWQCEVILKIGYLQKVVFQVIDYHSITTN